MANTFSLLRQRCGLSQREAAAFLKTGEEMIGAWDEARHGVPFDAIMQLRTLYRRLEQTADAQVRHVRRSAPQSAILELGVASDDFEARQFGLPCVGAHEALLALIAARLNRHVRIVPAGSTVATAAAMQAYER